MGKGSGRRPGEGYGDGHELIFGKRERKQYVPPPLPDAPASKEDAEEDERNDDE